jgi:hypothetical protein
MTLRLVVFVLAFSMLALAQRPAGAGKPAQQGKPAEAARPAQAGRPEARPGKSGEADVKKDEGKQKGESKREEHAAGKGKAGLTDKETKSGAFKMLQRKTGKSEEELRAMYASSGAKNFGQFVSGIVAARNLGLNEGKVLSAMEHKPLEQVLQEEKGISRRQAQAEVRRAEREVREAEREAEREAAREPVVH